MQNKKEQEYRRRQRETLKCEDLNLPVPWNIHKEVYKRGGEKL